MRFNNNMWTAARFHSFIKGALRQASIKWPPKNEVKKAARIERGVYRCNGYKRTSHQTSASLPPKKGNKRRINNAVVDHIHPVVDPKKGFTTWDNLIKRMFVDSKGLQVLCHDCHTRKTNDEKEIAKQWRKKMIRRSSRSIKR